MVWINAYFINKELFTLKKLLSVLLVCVLAVGLTMTAVMPVSAATPKEQLVDCAKENLPAEMIERYLPAIENTLRVISVSQEQADQVADCIVETREYFESTGGFKGVSLHSYTLAQQQYAIEMVQRMCDILNLSPRFSFSTNAQHENDTVVSIYDANGKCVAVLDGDAVKQTNTPYDVNFGYVAAAAALLLGAVVVAVMGKKFAAQR